MKKRVLVVDDDDFVRDVVSCILTSGGYEVINAIHGLDALSKLNDTQVGLVVSDLMMPEMNGLQFIAELKTRDHYRHTPVVMLTSALPPSTGVDEIKKAGIDEWIRKPIRGEVLLEVVGKWIKDDRRQTAAAIKPAKERKNCWDVKKCGRHKGGAYEHERGICPAALEKRLDGVHGGINGGRSCWIVSGTLCDGKTQGTFIQKYYDCTLCDFYNMVREEEFPDHKSSSFLLDSLTVRQ